MTAGNRPRVCVAGIWHLGLVTSACLAGLGFAVCGYDADAAKVEQLNQGRPPLHEPGVEELLIAEIGAGRLRYTGNLSDAVRGAALIILAIDTPVDDEDRADLSGIIDTVTTLAEAAEPEATIAVSSQVPVGTCDRIGALMRARRPDWRGGIACLPENLRLGQAIERFRRPDMLVVGTDSAETLARLAPLLDCFEAPRVLVDLRTAEMAKHAINAYLATCISFANELANLSDLAGADGLKVAEALRLEGRVNPRAPLSPGLGFAGGTLARDLRVLQSLAAERGYEAPLVNGVLALNALQNRMVIDRLVRSFDSLEGRTVGMLGLTYKSGTSTLRRSPALEMIEVLTAAGARVRAYDPLAEPLDGAVGGCQRCGSAYEAAAGADALVLVTPWPEFKELDWARLRAATAGPLVLDAQNFLDPAPLQAAGFICQGVGRRAAPQAGRQRV